MNAKQGKKKQINF